MISSSKRLSFPALAALVLVAAGCSYSGEGQIPCVQDASCPADYPVCGSAGKCIAGLPTATSSVAITGVDGHAATDYLRGAVRVLVSARAASGVRSLKLAAGSVNFPASTLPAASPLYAFDVDTTTLADGDATITATLTAGDNSGATATGTLHVDNAKPVITAFTASGSTSTTITAGTTALLSVTFAPPTASATITSGGGSITLGSTGSVLVSPDSTTTFTLRVTSRSGVTVQSGTAGQPPDVTVSVVSPASMTGNFTVSPSVITSGDLGQITFALPSLSASVTAAFIRDDLGNVVIPDALTTLSTAKPGSTRTYTLVARNAAGATATATTSVTVRGTAGLSNTTLLASAASVTVGGSITLTPTFPVAYTGSISGTGLSSPLVVTSGQLYPVTITAAGTSAYTLTVQNDANPVATFTTAATNVSGVAVPAIVTFTASASTVTNTNTVTFTYNVTGGDCVATPASCRITGPSFSLDILGTNDGSNHVTTAATPTSSSTSTYILTLINSTGTAAGTVSHSIPVQAVPPVGAFTFSVTPTTVNLSATGNLTFTQPVTIANAASAVIGGGGQSSGNVLGQSTATLPVPGATTTYTLTVKNAAGDVLGTATKTATLLVGESLGQGSITAARYGAAAVRLPDGRVLVTGGSKDGTLGANALATATVFDPQTGSFSDGDVGTTFAMQTARAFHTATLINSTAPFSIYVVGGTTAVTTAEMITVKARGSGAATSSAGDALFGVNSSSGHRCFHNAVLVPGTTDPRAQVLLVGGSDCAGAAAVTDSVELWTQGTGHALQTSNALMSSHVSGTATLLIGGALLVAGGGNNKAQVRAAPVGTNSPWSSEKTMGSVRTGHSATLLANGKVLLAGGATAAANTVTPSADIYDPGTGNFTAVGSGLATARADHAAVLLSSGLVLVLGGDDRGSTPTSFATSEFYDAATDKFFLGPSLLTARKQFVAVSLTASTSLSGTLFIAGGTGATAAVSTPAEAMILP